MKYSYFRLDELGIVSRGRSKHRPRNDSSLYGGKYPFIQTADVKNAGLYITEWSQTYNERGLAQSKLWHPGTLCITIAANIADTAILCMPACFPDSIMGFIPYEDKCDVKYMKYCFDILQMKCQQIAEGTAQDNLSWEKLSTIQFPVPDITTQKRIASILSAYDDLIENNRRQIKLLEEAAQRLYREWFVELRFPGHEDVKIVDGVPEGWKEGIIGDIAQFQRGKTIRKTDITVGSIPVVAGGLEPAYYHNKANTVGPVITVSGSGANAGHTKLYNESIFASDCSFVDSTSTPYLFFLFCCLRDRKAEIDSLQKGAAQPHVYAKDINALRVIIPTQSILGLFMKIATSLFEKREKAEMQIRICIEARDRLLPKLMSGEMEV